jgi:nucleotide-binding universal stress UspA family protein
MAPLKTENSAGPIMVCLDGSPDSDAAASLALGLAMREGLPVAAVHVYDAGIHVTRFRQMEPGLPPQYQAEGGLKELRDSHGTLMSDGFQALSHGYMERFLTLARQAGVEVHTEVEEGRNYVGLLKIAGRLQPRIIAMGAAGLGDLGDGNLGSTAQRLLRKLTCGVLVGRAGSPEEGPVLAGIDGSEHALASLGEARSFSRFMNAPLHLLAAYDPALHQRVFKAMADTMPPEAQAAVGLDKQEGLHESLIDDGLGTLYQTFLDEAAGRASAAGTEAITHLVADKGYPGIISKAREINAGLICLGRFGHNREDESDIGATAENVVRMASCSVLVTAPFPDEPSSTDDQKGIAWEADALERLNKIPRFARKMARRSIEAAAREEGARSVTAKHVDMVSERFRGKK